MTRYHQIAVETLTTIVLLNIILQLKKAGQNFKRSAIEIKKANVVFYKRIQNSKNSQKKYLTNTSVKLRKEEEHQIKSN